MPTGPERVAPSDKQQDGDAGCYKKTGVEPGEWTPCNDIRHKCDDSQSAKRTHEHPERKHQECPDLCLGSRGGHGAQSTPMHRTLPTGHQRSVSVAHPLSGQAPLDPCRTVSTAESNASRWVQSLRQERVDVPKTG